jgi:ABC-type phosphate/phosphonate transport system substrate-binding protein
MTRFLRMCLPLALLAIAACQPELVLVEVTRIVDVTPASTDVTLVEQADESEPEVVEVTRLVREEVTRVISSTVVEEVVVEVTKSPLGTAERPVQLLFPPIASNDVIVRRAHELAEFLSEESELKFEVGIVDDESTIVQLMCDAPGDTVGFLSPTRYVTALRQCDAQAGNVALDEHGFSWKMGMLVVRRDSGIQAFEDLAGRSWATPDSQNIVTHLFFQAAFAEAGIEPGEIMEVPGDSSAMLAVYNGDADFATAVFVPPILPFGERWQHGVDDPELWRRLGIPPRRSPIGYILVNGEPEFGGYRLRDARSRIFDIVPGIFSETRVLSLTAPIANDTIAFGSSFPLSIGRAIIDDLIEFGGSDRCVNSLCSSDFYAWAGLDKAAEVSYEPLAFVIETLEIAEDEFPDR